MQRALFCVVYYFVSGSFMRKGKISIDRERCKGCYLCIRACPEHLISPDTNANSTGVYPASFSGSAGTGESKCIACGSCYQVCPDTAIEVYEL
jgi:2-oxoglutarate ferredoxin oxidoreductase subunit delta